MTDIKKRLHLSPFQIIIVGFLSVILIGTLFLLLPPATVKQGSATFMEAFFTATSAVCVTGLVMQDTATYWSLFGQIIILCLIQIGGMGVVTLAVTIARIAGKRIELIQRSSLQEAVAAPNIGGVVKMAGFIISGSLLIELIGAVVMAPIFIHDFGTGKGIWYAVFHSVSAFCNAGFDLMGINEKFSSLTAYANHPVIIVTAMLLLLIGGLGFLTWEDIRSHGIHLKRYRTQSKMILLMTVVLVILPTVYYYFFELSRPVWSQMNHYEKFLAALFQAVSPRTAGFNTIDANQLTDAGRSIIIILMLIGGAPGSTAGGMKTTTVAVLFWTSIAVFRRKQDVNCFGRRLAEDTVKYAAAVLMMYLSLFLTGGIAISYIEGLPLVSCLFETASAIATVGLTLGITPSLGTASYMILIVLMFLGRVGGLTLIFAAISRKRVNISRFPESRITVG